jgi:hypothetical protein
MSDQKTNRPVARLRENALTADIWENKHENGLSHNVSFSKSYQDKDGNWQRTSNFGDRDLLSLKHLVSRAHDTVRERQSEQRKEDRPQSRQRRTRTRDHER